MRKVKNHCSRQNRDFHRDYPETSLLCLEMQEAELALSFKWLQYRKDKLAWPRKCLVLPHLVTLETLLGNSAQMHFH